MLIRHAQDIAPLEITDYQLYLNRRSFLIGMAALALSPTRSAVAAPSAGEPLPSTRNERFTLEDSSTSLESITTSNHCCPN